MNTTPDPTERTQNSAHLSGTVLRDSLDGEQDSSLRVQLGEHLDATTRDEITGNELIRQRMARGIDDSLQDLERSARSTMEYVKKNPLPVIAAVAGIAAIFAALSRRNRW